MVKIYGIKNCGSVKKALDTLNANGVKYEFIDFKTTAPSKEQIAQWVSTAGIEIVLNTKGQTYKKLGLKDKNLNETQKIEAMHQSPNLIKRPVIEIIQSNKVENLIIGFNEDTISSIK
ncbi:arsenate reductase family protein [Helicobacter sp. 23-1046]